MDACLDTGAYCMIDVHNFARYDGGIIGQGGPEDEAFVDLWVSLAKKYVDNEKIIFGLMNEPHDLDINIWAETCQKVVTGIREAGAEKHMILLPGTNFASAETFVSSGSAEALAAITNPDGSTDGLLLDIHKYLDINNSGSHMECTTDNVEQFKEIIEWLRDNDRKAMVSESGASLDESVSRQRLSMLLSGGTELTSPRSA
jgi:endoglucanase